MTSVLVVLGVFLLGVAHVCYLYRHRLRRWWRADVVGRDSPPHERWPEILHWQEDDEFSLPLFCRYTRCSLVSLHDDGYAAVRFIDERWWEPIQNLAGRNKSLLTRRVSAEVRRDGDYMKLIEEFQKAYRELEERDKKLKMVS